MFILNIFSKYKLRSNREKILKTLIKELNLEEKEKRLYLESMTLLNDKDFEGFYYKIIKLIENIENKKRLDSLKNIKDLENKQKKGSFILEKNSFF
ncbi:MAG: hypothetical protein PHF46_00645 [Candidatus Gracilibacteria bacterium]|nr:hypothetical protein [Candidatus Gracilibacteria bacterium]MDD3119904.1 hypothetical protein [Candidatus Gracilibacteria bacterium]MDD4530075.1 hypothetical protein [Candidatus Gracilibacteria bacterium]